MKPTLCARCGHNVSFHGDGGICFAPDCLCKRPAAHAADRYWPPDSQTTRRLREIDALSDASTARLSAR